jgi:death-on-curing protein
VEKAAALCFSLVKNHPFVDGNKRIAHAAMEVFLVLNDHELKATVQEAEQIMLALASSSLSREQLVQWLRSHLVAKST